MLHAEATPVRTGVALKHAITAHKNNLLGLRFSTPVLNSVVSHNVMTSCSPSLFRRSTVVHMSDTSSPLDSLACQHMVMCDYQHILRPWTNDVGKEEAEAPRRATTAVQLLQNTCEGTVSGFSFMEATEYMTEPLLVRSHYVRLADAEPVVAGYP